MSVASDGVNSNSLDEEQLRRVVYTIAHRINDDKINNDKLLIRALRVARNNMSKFTQHQKYRIWNALKYRLEHQREIWTANQQNNMSLLLNTKFEDPSTDSAETQEQNERSALDRVSDLIARDYTPRFVEEEPTKQEPTTDDDADDAAAAAASDDDGDDIDHLTAGFSTLHLTNAERDAHSLRWKLIDPPTATHKLPLEDRLISMGFDLSMRQQIHTLASDGQLNSELLYADNFDATTLLALAHAVALGV